MTPQTHVSAEDFLSLQSSEIALLRALVQIYRTSFSIAALEEANEYADKILGVSIEIRTEEDLNK